MLVGKMSQILYRLFYYYGVRQFCVDMAHGDSECCIETVKYLRKLLDTRNGAPESFLHYISRRF